MSVSFTGAVGYQGCNFSTCILREITRDKASSCAHRQAKIIDGAKRPQRGTLTRIRDGESKDARRPISDREKGSDLDIECDTASWCRE